MKKRKTKIHVFSIKKIDVSLKEINNNNHHKLIE